MNYFRFTTPRGVQIQLEIGCGGLDQDSLEDVGIHSLEEDGVSEDGLKQGGIEAGEVIRVVIDPVLGLVIVTEL